MPCEREVQSPWLVSGRSSPRVVDDEVIQGRRRHARHLHESQDDMRPPQLCRATQQQHHSPSRLLSSLGLLCQWASQRPATVSSFVHVDLHDDVPRVVCIHRAPLVGPLETLAYAITEVVLSVNLCPPLQSLRVAVTCTIRLKHTVEKLRRTTSRCHC